MEHERLANVPYLCEICYDVITAPFAVLFIWPGAGGQPVHVHSGACHDAACDHIRGTAKKRKGTS